MSQQLPTDEELLEGVTSKHCINDVYSVGQKAVRIKEAYAKLRREKKSSDIDRMLKRVPLLDLPDILSELASAVAGSFYYYNTRIELLESILMEGEPNDPDDESYNDDELSIESQLEHAEEALDRLALLEKLTDYLGSLSYLPDDVTKARASIIADIKSGRDDLTTFIDSVRSPNNEADERTDENPPTQKDPTQENKEDKPEPAPEQAEQGEDKPAPDNTGEQADQSEKE